VECKEVVELIPAYVKGELTRNQMNEVSEHLQNCNSCYEEAEKWKSCLPNFEVWLATPTSQRRK